MCFTFQRFHRTDSVSAFGDYDGLPDRHFLAHLLGAYESTFLHWTHHPNTLGLACPLDATGKTSLTRLTGHYPIYMELVIALLSLDSQFGGL